MRKLIAVIALFAFSRAFAYEIAPMFQMLDVGGKGSKGSYEIVNSGDTDILVEALIHSVRLDSDNKEVLTPGEQDFLILPPQGRVPAGEMRRFRIQYLGNALIPQTKIYRVIFKQIATSDDSTDSEGQIKFLVEFSTAVFVSPINCKPEVDMRISGGELIFVNPSSCVYNLTQKNFEFKGQGGTKEFSWVDLKARFSGYLIPGTTRKVALTEDMKAYSSIKLIN